MLMLRAGIRGALGGVAVLVAWMLFFAAAAVAGTSMPMRMRMTARVNSAAAMVQEEEHN